MSGENWFDPVAILKGGGRFTPAVFLFGAGIYGGGYAKSFKLPFDDWASILCLASAAIGIVLLAATYVCENFAGLQKPLPSQKLEVKSSVREKDKKLN